MTGFVLSTSTFINPAVTLRNRTCPSRPYNRSTTTVQRSHRTAIMSANSHDLLIIGAGVLGCEIAKQWSALYPEAKITGETLTDKSHDHLRSLNIVPRISNPELATPKYVAFCAPPSSDDYVKSIMDSLKRPLLDGDAKARFVVTSSSGVVGRKVALVTETSPADKTVSGRTAMIAEAESQLANHNNALVIRLSGLYTINRGAHSYWLKIGHVKSSPSGRLNLIHYKDAASAVIATLLVDSEAVAKWPHRVLLACANRYISRGECCAAALKHPLYKDAKMPTFEDGSEETGPQRLYNNEWSRSVLNWAPKWESFADFINDEVSVLQESSEVKS